MDNPEARGRHLLSQLEPLLRSAGFLTVSYKPERPAPTPLSIDPDLPPSLAFYAVRSLARQAEDAAREKIETNAKIQELCRHEDRNAAHNCLNADYVRFRNEDTTEDFRRLELAQKSIALRTAQARARDAEEKTFSVDTIASMCPITGRATDQLRYYLPLDISREGFQSALQDMTRGDATRAAGYAYGYTLEHGKWLYQLHGVDPSTTFHDLARDSDYDNMRKALHRSPTGRLLVWHERLLAASKKAREEHPLPEELGLNFSEAGILPEELGFDFSEAEIKNLKSLEDFEFESDLSDTERDYGWRAFDQMIAKGEDVSHIKFDGKITEEEVLQMQHAALTRPSVGKQARKRKAMADDQESQKGHGMKKMRSQSM